MRDGLLFVAAKRIRLQEPEALTSPSVCS
uniref:Uncharacterized protein n=1 Tax=Anguilla anguilla TaxID=7936 RepID=A0A0E9QUX1_ANGAN